MSTRRRVRPSKTVSPRWFLLGVLGITALAYLNSLDGAFIYDDRLQIARNPTLDSPRSLLHVFSSPVWQFLATAPGQQAGPYFRPICTASQILQHLLFGNTVTGWHCVSLGLHLLATFLVFKVAVAWGFEQPIALAAALLLGLHPVHSESVAWITAVPDPMAAVFILTALLLHERGRWLAAAAVGPLAMLTKETAIVLPAVLFVRHLATSTSPLVRRV